MSHGKVIKNRSLGQAHSLKVYMIFLFLSLSLLSSLYVVFMPLFSVVDFLLFAFSAFWSEGIILPKTQFQILFSIIEIHSIALTVEPPLHQSKWRTCCSYALHQWCRLVIWRESRGLTFLMNTGVMVILPLKKVQHAGIAYREQYICFVVMPPFLIHTYKKNAVYKIFSYSQGALSRLLEASALIA